MLLQSYPTISDGSYVLSVNKTVISFISDGQTLNANATYKTVAGVSQNSSIVFTLIQDPANPLVNSSVSYDPATGNLTAAINDVPSNGVSLTGVFAYTNARSFDCRKNGILYFCKVLMKIQSK